MKNGPLGPVGLSQRLRAVLAELSSRQKAIKYRLQDFSHEVEGDIENGAPFHRLNIDALLSGGRPTGVRLSIWDDGQMWLRVAKPGPASRGGWTFLDSFHGSVSDMGAGRVVQLLELTLNASRGISEKSINSLPMRLREIWAEAIDSR